MNQTNIGQPGPEELAAAKATTDAIARNIEKLLVGQSQTIRYVLTALICSGHVLLEDTPGTGKTMMAKALAASIEGRFSRIQFTPDLLPSDVTGLYYYNQKESQFLFRKGPVFSNILLADEINRATPRTQSALLECMEERQVTIDGITHSLAAPFFVIATENPIETAGTFPLPEAQLDRFMMKLSMGLPNRDGEIEIMNRFITDEPLASLGPVCTTDDLLRLTKLYRLIYIHPSLMGYIADLVRATRENTSVVSGVSPRGTLSFMRCAQAYALLMGRDYVVPEDIKELAMVVLPHRIVTTRGYGTGDIPYRIVSDILSRISVPTEDFTRR